MRLWEGWRRKPQADGTSDALPRAWGKQSFAKINTHFHFRHWWCRMQWGFDWIFFLIMSPVIMKLVLRANKNLPSAKNDFKANLLLRRQDYDKDGRQDCIGVTTNFISIMDNFNHSGIDERIDSKQVHVAGVGVVTHDSSIDNLLTGSFPSPEHYLRTFSRLVLEVNTNQLNYWIMWLLVRLDNHMRGVNHKSVQSTQIEIVHSQIKLLV